MNFENPTLLSADKLCAAFIAASFMLLSPYGEQAHATSLPKSSSLLQEKISGLPSPPLQLGELSPSPMAWSGFCMRYRSECSADSPPSALITLDMKTMQLLQDVNNKENKRITYMADQDHWNEDDQWDLAQDGKGDCEDYALSKRHILMKSGLPALALLPAEVYDKNDERHAVLVIRTDKGDLVLDNQTNEIHTWQISFTIRHMRFIAILDPADANEIQWRDLTPNNSLQDNSPQETIAPTPVVSHKQGQSGLALNP